MARAGLTPQTVTRLALAQLDESGPAGLTLKAVAERPASPRPPSTSSASLEHLRI